MRHETQYNIALQEPSNGTLRDAKAGGKVESPSKEEINAGEAAAPGGFLRVSTSLSSALHLMLAKCVIAIPFLPRPLLPPNYFCGLLHVVLKQTRQTNAPALIFLSSAHSISQCQDAVRQENWDEGGERPRRE